MKKVSHAFTYDHHQSDEGKVWIYTAYIILFTVILISTYLHHSQPQILNVPSNSNVSLWDSPKFEDSRIYERMTEKEKDTVRSEGIPNSSISSQFIGDIVTILLALLCFLHARKHYGLWLASCFFIGSFVFTGLEESMWILTERFFGHSIDVLGGYWFTRGGFWFIEAPVSACLGWFFLAYACVMTAGKIFPNMGVIARAAIGSLIAMTIDLWLDPVVTSPEILSWVWAKGDPLVIFGIPHTNFVGWFLLIFLFAIFWENLPVMENKWGRVKAGNLFFVILFATEVAILIFFFAWCFVLGHIINFAGFGPELLIPPGW